MREKLVIVQVGLWGGELRSRLHKGSCSALEHPGVDEQAGSYSILRRWHRRTSPLAAIAAFDVVICLVHFPYPIWLG